MLLKRGLILLVFLLSLQVSFAQQDSCLVAHPTNVNEAAARIWGTYSQIPKYAGDNNAILQAALQGLENWQPENIDPNWVEYKLQIENEIRKIVTTENIRLNFIEGEYLVPNDVLKALFTVTMNTEWDSPWNNPGAVYLNIDYIPTSNFDIFPALVYSSRGERFKSLLRGRGFSNKEAERYYSLASTPGNILISEEDYRKDVHFHERIHKIISQELNEEGRGILFNAREEYLDWMQNNIVKTRTIWDEGKEVDVPIDFFNEHFGDQQISISLGDWQELYAYMAQYKQFPSEVYHDRIDSEVYIEFEKRYHEAYVLYSGVVDIALQYEKLDEGRRISTGETTNEGNIFLCNPEENIPIPFCSNNVANCINGASQTFNSMDNCLRIMSSQLSGKHILYQPSSESLPRCRDFNTFKFEILDDSGKIYKPHLAEIKIEIFDDSFSCQVGLATGVFYICNPDSVDTGHYCTHDPDRCRYGYTSVIVGSEEECKAAIEISDGLLENSNFNLCQTGFGIFYIPFPLIYGTLECKEGDRLITKTLAMWSDEIGLLLESLNGGDSFLCGGKLKECIKGGDFVDLGIAYTYGSLNLCSERFETESACIERNKELGELYDYKICYNKGKDKLECKKRDENCGDYQLNDDQFPFSESECPQRIEEIGDGFVFGCEIGTEGEREEICSNNFEDCSLHKGFIFVYPNFQSCYGYKIKDSTMNYLFQDRNLWRCVNSLSCIGSIAPEKLRYFQNFDSCSNEAKRLNGREWVLHYIEGGKIYECTGNIVRFASECSPPIEGLYQDLVSCQDEATRLNQNKGYSWYLCRPKGDSDSRDYFCAESMNDCYFDTSSTYSPLQYVDAFTTEGDCKEKETEFNNNRWYLCHNGNGENYNCQLGLGECEQSVTSFNNFWTCSNWLEEVQPSSDESVDVLFIPVNWRGSVGDYKFYAEIQKEVLLETAELSGLDISSFNLNVHYIEDLDLCNVPNIQSSSIDNRVIDCVNRISSLGFDFNPLKDKIIALTDEDMGNTLGFTSSTFPYLNIVKYERKATLAHELGHSALNLCDEYAYEDWNRQNADRKCPNPYPTCCFDNPQNRRKQGLNCYPEGTPIEWAEDHLCQGTICDPTNAEYCRSVMGPGKSLAEIQNFYDNSLEVKYLTWELDERGGQVS